MAKAKKIQKRKSKILPLKVRRLLAQRDELIDSLRKRIVEEPVKKPVTEWQHLFSGPKNFEEEEVSVMAGFGSGTNGTNPKTLMGQQKLPILSVVPPVSLIEQAAAMRYGAFLAERADGSKGYGPYNWRDQPIESHIYIDAAMRHLLAYQDGEDHEVIRNNEGEAIDLVSHLGFAIATLGILIDAKANNSLIDTRPKKRQMAVSLALKAHKIAQGKLK